LGPAKSRRGGISRDKCNWVQVGFDPRHIPMVCIVTISKITAKLDNKLTYNAAKSIMRKGVSCRTNGPEVCPLFHDGGGLWMAFRRSRPISIAGRSKHQAFTAMQVIDRSAKICVVDGGYTDQFRGVVCTGAPCDQSVISRGTVR
jgi:hypothetical protein